MNEQDNEPIQGSKNIWIMIVAITIISLIVGGVVYGWQKNILKTTEQNLQQQITALQNQVNQFNQQEKTNQNVNNQITDLLTNTTNWLSFEYQNTEHEYNIEARYPSDYKLENNGITNNTTLTNPPTYFVIFDFLPPTSSGAKGQSHIEIGVSKNTGNLSDLSWALESKENVVIDGNTYELWHTSADNGTDAVYIYKDGNRYDINARHLKENPDMGLVFTEMLKTLKIGN